MIVVKSKWIRAIKWIIFIVVVGGGALNQASKIVQRKYVDEAPFGLPLPGSVTNLENDNELEEDMLLEFPDTWECQVYEVDGTLVSVIDFYQNMVSDWGDPEEIVTGEESGMPWILLRYAKGEDDLLLIMVLDSASGRTIELTILGYER